MIATKHNCSLIYGYYAVKNLPECASIIVKANLKESYYHSSQCETLCPVKCMVTIWNLAVIPEVAPGKAQITVLISHMSHIEISQKPKTTFWDFLSQLHGTLGLLGMSFFVICRNI